MSLVLVVEEDPTVREEVALLLMKQGLDVVVEDGRAGALRRLETRGVQLRAVIVGARLEDDARGGFAVLREFQARRPDVVRFVMTSSDGPRIQSEALDCRAYVFERPGTAEAHRAIAKLVREAEVKRTPSVLPPEEPAEAIDVQRREALALAREIGATDAETRVLVEAMGAKPSEVVQHAAARIGIADKTVLKHFNAIREKTRDKTIADLLARVRRRALTRALRVPPPPPPPRNPSRDRAWGRIEGCVRAGSERDIPRRMTRVQAPGRRGPDVWTSVRRAGSGWGSGSRFVFACGFGWTARGELRGGGHPQARR